ncbi:DNA repair protein XRCC3 homolog [Cicer arietinum]|uniref:DNA repair protein XRCC3 homolog n=1 Tax=Cicer arietinum TaxID=3827 RepID=A0A3Q7Y9T2_CICAR|nr:DNA repair protein XRCC3 homolog [Cicer arietinum]
MKTEAHNLLQKLHRRTEKCSVGCPILDRCLNGGIPCKSVTELVAESGSGKTQICLQLVLSAQLPPSHGGLSSSSLYIHTEFPFPIRRLKQLSRIFISSHSELLGSSDPCDRVFLRGVHSADEFVDAMPEIEFFLTYWKARLLPVRVIVVDSIAALFRSDFENSSLDLRKRSSLFFKISGGLKSLAERFGLAVLVTNQVVDFIGEDEGLNNGMRIGNFSELYSSGRRVCPALGLSWANCVNSRFFLSMDDEYEEGGGRVTKMRRLSVVFAPHLPQCSSRFVITTEGVFGVEMHKGNV